MQQKNNLIYLIKTLSLLAILIAFMIINIKLYMEVKEKNNYLKDQVRLADERKRIIDDFYKNNKLHEVSTFTQFNTIKLCTEKYFRALHNLNEKNEEENNYVSKNAVECLLKVLAPEYIEEFNITQDNIKEKFDNYSFVSSTIVTKTYEYNIKEGINMFLVNGNNYNEDATKKEEFLIMMVIDNNQKSFCIYPKEYIEKHKLNEANTNLKESSLMQIVEIPQNNYNKKISDIITNEKMVDYCFNLYKFYFKNDAEAAYEMLDEQYKNKKFKNFEEFKEYLTTNNKKYNNYLKSYKTSQYKNDKQFFCIDKNNNYLIFKLSNPLKISLILDTYTIDLPEFEEKYFKAEKTERVALNIQKVFDALNDKDYNYVYSKFSDGFKSNYFKTLEDFEKYAKNKFFDNNEVEYLYYEKESEEYYSYTIKIENAKNTSEYVNLKVIMKLQKGTDFQMSFNVN